MSKEIPVRLFETERLIVRQITKKDLRELTQILSDPDVMRYSVGGVCDEQATSRFIDWCLESYSSRGVGPWALVEKGTDDLVGFCGIGPEPVGNTEEFNLGYRLASRFWNRGLATEAAEGVLGYAFEMTSIESVVVIIEPEHTASLRVAGKAGFSEYADLEFHGRPVRLYRMNKQGWNALHNDGMRTYFRHQ
ncbi:GNAT family N-acetyltransferase [Marinobacterium arenosum]|uniref:GNAT family N-acetyltransferase n=1 Tax=Marinobacterium arenosum TaxID=2862496 RepID=UPI001C94ECAA|nr:GNAT family N-acetyltransferase [Marinobacterium arenosum]MBY4676249.1 GNAT family N-acetyltransferase [Marinobacterium arenosum]